MKNLNKFIIFILILFFNFVFSQEVISQSNNNVLKNNFKKQINVKKNINDGDDKIQVSQLMFSLKLNGESFQNGVIESFDEGRHTPFHNLVVNSNGFKMTWYVSTDTKISNLTIKTKSSPKAVDTRDESGLKTSGTNLTIKPGSIPRLRDESLIKNQSTTTGDMQDLGTLRGSLDKEGNPESTTTIIINTPVRVHGYWDGSKLVAKKIFLSPVPQEINLQIEDILKKVKEMGINFKNLATTTKFSINGAQVEIMRNDSGIYLKVITPSGQVIVRGIKKPL